MEDHAFLQTKIPRKYLHLHFQGIGCSERGIGWLLCLLQMRHQRLDVLWVIHVNRQGTGIELHRHSSGLILPAFPQKRRHCFPADQPNVLYGIEQRFNARVDLPVYGR